MKEYLEFFGLRDDPFKITPDANYFFLSEAHQEALTALKYLVQSEEGFAVIIGEPGTGKTLTVRKFIDELPDEVEFAYIFFPNLSPEELFEAILEDFGISSKEDTKNRLFAKMRDFLIQKRLSGKKVLIIIDEAQNLPIETLEELRILSNLETENQKLLNIILLGQPELEEKLSSEKLRQLNQRITVRAKLRNLTEKETQAYVNYRLAKAGGGNVKLSKKLFPELYHYSMGIPRLINILMERSLMAAFVEGTNEVTPKHLKRAVESVGLQFRQQKTRILPFLLIGIIAVFSIFGLLYILTLYTPADSDKGSEPKLIKPLSNQKKEMVTPSVKDKKQDKAGIKFEYAVVDTPLLNMRQGPDAKSDVVYVLKEGDILIITEKGPFPWVKATYEKGHIIIEGWVNLKYLRFFEKSNHSADNLN